MAFVLLFAGAAVFGCEGPAPPSPGPAPQSCEAVVAQSALSAVDRRIVGQAVPYLADNALRARDQELAHSVRARRNVAWEVVGKVLAAAPLQEPLPNADAASLPSWQTWYDREDLKRVFHHFYSQLSHEQRLARTDLDVASLDELFVWNAEDALAELPNWPQQRYAEYLQAIEDAAEVSGVGGISRVSYSPAAARHLLRSYPEVLSCRDSDAPPAQSQGPAEELEVARIPVELERCQTTVAGSFSIEADEELTVRLDAADELATLKLKVDGRTACAASSAEGCTVKGPGTVEVSVRADHEQVRSVLQVSRISRKPDWAACLAGPFPSDAVIIKADYRRADFQMGLPVFATSAKALERQLTGDAEWTASGQAEPTPEQVYTLKLPNETSYRLAALHIMTKELDHWLWITLFWSATPDEDFGSDRPEAIAALGGPWGHYKMAVVTAFEEQDPSPTGGYGLHSSLGRALAATRVTRSSWGTNPYLELGPGNAASNCIGCHQHGGTQLVSEEILLFGDQGRAQLRNNFPTDYSWAVTQGDELGTMFAQEEDYYLSRP